MALAVPLRVVTMCELFDHEEMVALLLWEVEDTCWWHWAAIKFNMRVICWKKTIRLLLLLPCFPIRNFLVRLDDLFPSLHVFHRPLNHTHWQRYGTAAAHHYWIWTRLLYESDQKNPAFAHYWETLLVSTVLTYGKEEDGKQMCACVLREQQY